MSKIADKTLGQLTNLATLTLGIAIGFGIGALHKPHQEVEAQAVPVPHPAIQEVAPTMTAGSIGTNLLLAHQVAADNVIINGIDVLRMQQNMLQYLANRPGAERADIQNLINSSVATTVYRMKPQTPPPAPAPQSTNPSPEKK